MERNGARSQFYNNMRLAAPGDRVLSFVAGYLGHVGTVVAFAEDAEKPEEFGEAGDYWASDGWELPVTWERLPMAVRPKPLIGDIRKWLPTKYSPIHPLSGNGSEKAYLCEIAPEIFTYVVERAGGDPARLIVAEPAATSQSALVREPYSGYDAGLEGSVRDQLVKARAGQGLFRRRVAEVERGCRLTGITNPTLLTASHIKPWRACSSTFERLDGFNGLLLAPHVDRLFDRGLITFEDDGSVQVSPRLPKQDLERLGLIRACAKNAGVFHAQQRSYLAYHRGLFLR